MRTCLLVITFSLAMSSAWAGTQPLVTINDPSGDDYGSGKLVYPQRGDFQTGDLDLLQLKISRDDEGFWFEAMFRNSIRDPASVANTMGAESLANFARKGFYQFNLDIYIDTDRVMGSGNIFTLPGRQVQIDPAYAWERAVVLTPRPELMRQQLLEALAEQYPDRAQMEMQASVDQALYFPTRIHVRGKSIAFFVPADFFAGSNGENWAVTAMVTGAMTSIPVDITLFPSTKKPLERLLLGVMQPVSGHPSDTFGYSGALPAPVVDLLNASAEEQVMQLAAKQNLTGVAWGHPGRPQAAGESLTVGQQASGSVKTAEPLAHLLQPENSADKSARTDATETKPAVLLPAESALIRRLQTLQQLHEQKLIDDAEYQEQKRRILKEL